MLDDDIKLLQKQAIDTIALAKGKMDFLGQHGLINPLAIMQNAVECLADWLIPKEPDDKGVPTNPDRLRFDIYVNEQVIKNCDEAMGQTSGGLHIVEGDHNGRG